MYILFYLLVGFCLATVAMYFYGEQLDRDNEPYEIIALLIIIAWPVVFLLVAPHLIAKYLRSLKNEKDKS